MECPQRNLDPRVKRTRDMLRTALDSLLQEKSFEDISVQDLAERSTLNRATFYDHYPDKFALLEDMIGEQFRTGFERRMEGTGGTCQEGLKQLVLAVCDFLTALGSRCQKARKQFGPMVESHIKGMVREYLLANLRRNDPAATPGDLELKATMASWAIYGAALEWCASENQAPEAFAESVRPIIQATLQMRC